MPHILGGKSKAGKGLGIMGRLWYLFLTFLLFLLFIGVYNHIYDQSSPHEKTRWDQEKEWVLDHIPNYHPRKNTKGTRRVQHGESKMKQKINEKMK